MSTDAGRGSHLLWRTAAINIAVYTALFATCSGCARNRCRVRGHDSFLVSRCPLARESSGSGCADSPSHRQVPFVLIGVGRPGLIQNRHTSACEALNPKVPARLLNGRAKTSAHLSASPFCCTSPCAGFEPSPSAGPVMKCSNLENPDPRSG
jgi:hypothetical protein